jgi:glycosyltransferase involved in cell wall biosynthesis
LPKLTVGISLKNPGRFLIFAVQSVFAQTYQDWELLLLDDASTDGSLEFATSLADDRVRVLSDGQSRSLAIRLNEMIHMARGEYFVRMDADDLMHPLRLQKQLDFLQQASEDTVLGTWAYSLSHDNVVLGIRKPVNRQKTGFAARLSFIHPTVMAPVRWFRRNPYLETPVAHWSEDAELWCRATGHSRFVTLQEPALFYREPSALSFEKSLGMYHASMNILQERYRNPRYRYLCSLTGEMFKLWGSGILDGLGKGHLLIRKRYRCLDGAGLEQATEIVRDIMRTSLPIRSRVLDDSRAGSASA